MVRVLIVVRFLLISDCAQDLPRLPLAKRRGHH